MGTFRHLELWFHVVHQLHLAVLFPEALPSIITAGDAIFLKSDLSCFGEKKSNRKEALSLAFWARISSNPGTG